LTLYAREYPGLTALFNFKLIDGAVLEIFTVEVQMQIVNEAKKSPLRS